jgi:DNA-binding MarR family transcriptional regulator
MDRQDSLGYQVNHLGRLLAQALRERIAPHGVVPGQFAQLLALYEKDEVTQNDLCDQVRIDQSTMAHTLKRMERDGLIQRSPDLTDRRSAVITLTHHARSLERRLTEAAQQVNRAATRGFTNEEVAVYLRLTSKAIANLQDRSAPSADNS